MRMSTLMCGATMLALTAGSGAAFAQVVPAKDSGPTSADTMETSQDKARAAAGNASKENCSNDIAALREEYAESKEYQNAYRSGTLEEVRQLREIAADLAERGNQEACRDIVSVMNSLMRERVAMNTGSPATDARQLLTDRLKKAEPVTKAAKGLSADEIEGTDLYNLMGERLGEVDDLVLGDDKSIDYALVQRGGFLGIGGDTAAIPWDRLRVTGDHSAFVVDMSAEDLMKAPDFDRERWASGDHIDQWKREVGSFVDSAADRFGELRKSVENKAADMTDGSTRTDQPARTQK